jgi:hypothetical protein
VASETIHRAEAIGNREHAEWLLAECPNDPVALRWAATAIFYSALHGISAYLVARNVVVSRHDDRAIAMDDSNAGIPVDVRDAYQYLKRRSVGARYQSRVFSVGELRYLIDTPLAKILDFVGIEQRG